MRSRYILLCLVAIRLLHPTSALALEDCSAYLDEVDAKAEAARAAGQDPSIVLEIRKSLAASCAYLDEASVRKMVDSIDQLLPAMAAMKQYQQQAAQAAPPPEPAPASRPAAPAGGLPRTGHSLGGRFVDRPDAMQVFAVWDMDLERGKARVPNRARVLYDTRPSLEQAVRPDWEQVIYVVEVDPAGEVVQHLIHREQKSDHMALALRRGAGEVLWQRQVDRPESDAFLELWSVADQARVSRVPAPSPFGPDGKPHQWGAFVGPTTDGDVFYMSVMPAPRGAPTSTIAWFEATPEGRVVGQGSLTRGDTLAPYPAVDADAGSGAVMLTESINTGDGIQTRIATPIEREVAGRKMFATVALEKRLLVLSDDARTFWESPALERMLAWDGEMAIPQDLPPGEMMRQNQQQMAMMAATNRAVGGGRSVESLDSGYRRIEMIKPLSGDRYVALVDVTDDRRLDPPRHGPYLLEVSADKVDERLYLEPLAAAMDARLTALAVSPDDEMYVFALLDNGAGRVLKVEPDWTVSGYADAKRRDGIGLDGMVADAGGVWVFGHGLMEGKGGERLWAERVVFDTP